jgi:hypothetical protein
MTGISRYRHAIALYNKTTLFVHGGFEPALASQPLDTMVAINLAGIGEYKPITNNWTEEEKKEERREERKDERKILAPNNNIHNIAQSNHGSLGNREPPTVQNPIQQALKSQGRRDPPS